MSSPFPQKDEGLMKLPRRNLVAMILGAPLAACVTPAMKRGAASDAESETSAGAVSRRGKATGMFKVNVMYPYAEGARFDHIYYRETHMPMVKARLGDVCRYYSIDMGISSREAGEPPPFVAMCSFVCTSIEGYRAATKRHSAEIRGDITKYTDIKPIIQISEIVVERSDD